MKSLIYFYILINVLVFILMYIDKIKAKKNLWRIKEKTLFKLYFLGGFVGGFFGILLFKHKTRKPKFYFAIIISLIFHIIINIILINIYKIK